MREMLTMAAGERAADYDGLQVGKLGREPDHRKKLIFSIIGVNSQRVIETWGPVENGASAWHKRPRAHLRLPLSPRYLLFLLLPGK